MFILNKTKILIALGALFGGISLASLISSDESEKQPKYLNNFNGKVDSFADDFCNERPLTGYNFKVTKNISLPFYEFKKFSVIDLNNKADVYKSNAWLLFSIEEGFNKMERAEFERNNALPPEFIEIVKSAKRLMNKLHNISKISLKNVMESSVHYDLEKEQLRIPLKTDLAGIYSRIWYYFAGEVNTPSYLFIDVSFEDMKLITTEPEHKNYIYHLLFEQVEKGGLEEGGKNYSSYALTAISPKIDVVERKLEYYGLTSCGVYSNEFERKTKPISEGMLGTLKVKNPRLCNENHTNCKELTISNSF